MTTNEIANELVSLLRAGNFDGVYDGLFHHEQVRHIEPQSPHFPELTGVKAIKEKDALMMANIANVDSLEVGDAAVSAKHIAVPYNIAISMKDGSNLALNEIILYEVQDGKIISEQFFY